MARLPPIGGNRVCATRGEFPQGSRGAARAISLGVAFATRNQAPLATRNLVLKTMRIPLFANIAIGRSLRDPIHLPPAPWKEHA
jgi:hypothetical protein